MSKKENNFLGVLLGIAASAFAIGALSLVFDNNKSRIVSKEGRKALNDSSDLDSLINNTGIIKKKGSVKP